MGMKKIMALLLALVMVVGLLPLSVFAAEDLTIEVGKSLELTLDAEEAVSVSFTAEKDGASYVAYAANPFLVDSVSGVAGWCGYDAGTDNYYCRIDNATLGETYSFQVRNTGAAGTATVYLVEASQPAQESVTLALENPNQVFAGATASVRLSAEPFYNIPAGFTITSSDPQVVAVSFEHTFGATVRFVGKGTATLTAAWTGADGTAQAVSCQITVEKEALPLSLDSEQSFTLQPQESAAYMITNTGTEEQWYAFYVSGVNIEFNWDNLGTIMFKHYSDYEVMYCTVPAESSAVVFFTNIDPDGQTIAGTVGVKQRVTPQQGDARLVAEKTQLKSGEYMDIALQFSSVAMWDDADLASWTSSNESIVAVDNQYSDSCQVHAKGLGTATVTVTTESGLTASCEISVFKETFTLTTGTQSITLCEGGYDLLFTPDADGLYFIHKDNTTLDFGSCLDADGNMPEGMRYNRPGDVNGYLLRLTGGKQYTIPLDGPVGATTNVTVEPLVKAPSFSVNVTSNTGYAGGEGELAFDFPEGTADFLTITSDNEAVAEVDQQLAELVWIHFRSPGTANITITNGTQTEVVPVTVMEPDDTLAKGDKLTLTLQPRQHVAIDAIVTEAKEYSIIVNDPKISAASGYARSGADANYSVTKVYMSPDYNSNIFTVGNYVYDEAVTVEVYFTDAVTPDSFSLSKTELTLQTGEDAYLEGAISPVAGIEWVDWFVDDPAVAMVDHFYGGARVTAVGVGTATVTGTTVSGLTATCTVTVTEPEVTLKLDETQTVQIPGHLMNIRFTPAETGIYWLSQPYETMVYGSVQVTDAEDAVSLESFWHDDAGMMNGGQAAKLVGGQTYIFQFTSGDGEGDSPVFTMRSLPAPTGITLPKTEVSGQVGDGYYVVYTVSPAGAPGHVTAIVADKSVVEVYTYEQGAFELWLRKPGATTVTLRDIDGNTAELKVTCEEPVATLTAAGQTASAELTTDESATFRFTFPEDGEFYIYTDSGNVSVKGQMDCSYCYEYNNDYQGYICGGTAGQEFYLVVTNRGEARKVNVGVAKPVAPEGIEVLLTEDKLSACTAYVGEVVDVYAILAPALAFSPDLTFSSSNPAVADIEGGMSINHRTLRLFGTGTATITAEAGGLKAEATITVIEPEKHYEYGQVAEYTLQPGERIAYSVSVGEDEYEGIFVSTKAVGVKLSGGGFAEYIDTGDDAVYKEYVSIGLGTATNLLILENLQDEAISGKFYMGEEVPVTGLVIPEKLTGYAGEVLIVEEVLDPFYGIMGDWSLTCSDSDIVEDFEFNRSNMYVPLVGVGTARTVLSYEGKEYPCEVTVLCDCFNHVFQVSAKAATCTESGILAHWVCDDCGKTYEDKAATRELTSVAVPAAGHKEEIVSGKAATCTEGGLTEGKKCSVCGTVTKPQGTVAALGHEEEVIPGKAATCTEEGLTEGKKCSVCGTVTVAQKTIGKLAHKEEVIPGKAATCTEEGLTKGKKCSVCGTVTVAQKTIGKLAHKEEVIPGKAATCTEEGLTEGRKCSVCGTVTVEQKTIGKLAHKEEAIPGKAATCTEEGLTEGRKCSVCGTVTVAQKTIGKLAHKEEVIPGKAATCTEEGLTEGRKCSVCGTVTAEQKVIAAAGHKLVKTEAKAATYTAEGNIEYWTCSVCGKLFTDEKGETEITDPASVITAKLVHVDHAEENKVNVSEEAVDQAIEEALKDSTGSGDSSSGEATPAPGQEILIPLNQVDTKVENAVLPVTSVNKVAEAKASLSVQLTEAKVTMDTQTLKTIADTIKTSSGEIPADSKVSLKVETVRKEAVEQILTQSQKTALVNTNVVAVVSASLIVESAQETKSIHDFGGGKITIRLPFTPEEGKSGEDYTILYVAEDGETELIDTSYEGKHLVFAVGHFSDYVIVETASLVPPADPDSPPTGDNAVLLPVLVLMAVAVLGITALLLNKKRIAK